MTNEEGCSRIQNAIGVLADLLIMVKKRKQMIWPHLEILCLGKDNSAGDSERARMRGRQNKIWEDNLKEWTGMEFGDPLLKGSGRHGKMLQRHMWCSDDRHD